MNPDKDYYRILGVLDDAEDVVIRAAYRALAQRYHPDKWQGDPAEATRRMVEINAAYAVLSDTEKRAAYDATRDKNQFQDEPPEAEDANEAINKDWELAVKYLPDLKLVETDLHALSRELAFTFRLMLLESKRFDESVAVAEELEHGYLAKYFGDQAEVQAFAKELILEGRKDAAKELNAVARVLGRVDLEKIERISREFKNARFRRERASLAKRICDLIDFKLRWETDGTTLINLVKQYSKFYAPHLSVATRKEIYGYLFIRDVNQYYLLKDEEKIALSSAELVQWIKEDSKILD